MPIESLTIAQITEQLASEIQKIAPTLMEYQCNYIASLLVSAGWRKMPADAEPYTAEELNDMLFTARTTAVREKS